MSEPQKKTYRHKNTPHHMVVLDRIYTFWVGQKVVRSHERKNYVDLISETGIVVELPTPTSPYLIVDNSNSSTRKKWGPTEAIPYSELVKGNSRRLRLAAKHWSDHLATLDENGFPIESNE
jgi:hypothetical protein